MTSKYSIYIYRDKVRRDKGHPEFMQALAYEVYMKNVTFGNLHKWVLDMGMTISKNTFRNWLKRGKSHLDSLISILKDAAGEGSRGRKVLTDFLGEADLKALMSDGYNTYTFLDGELEKTDHLICMAHAMVKFEKAYQYGEDSVAKEFADMISELYGLKTDMR